MRQVRQRGLQNVKHQCGFKYLKVATVNLLPFFDGMFQGYFMTSKMLQVCQNDCSVGAEVRNSSLLSASSRRSEDVKICVENTLGTTKYSSFRYAWRIILFWRSRCRACRVVDLKLPYFENHCNYNKNNNEDDWWCHVVVDDDDDHHHHIIIIIQSVSFHGFFLIRTFY